MDANPCTIPANPKIIERFSDTSKQMYQARSCDASDNKDSHGMDCIVECKDQLTKSISKHQKMQDTSNKSMNASSISSSELRRSSKKNPTHSLLDGSSCALKSKITKNVPGWWVVSMIISMRYTKETSIILAFIGLTTIILYSLKDSKTRQNGKAI